MKLTYFKKDTVFPWGSTVVSWHVSRCVFTAKSCWRLVYSLRRSLQAWWEMKVSKNHWKDVERAINLRRQGLAGSKVLLALCNKNSGALDHANCKYLCTITIIEIQHRCEAPQMNNPYSLPVIVTWGERDDARNSGTTFKFPKKETKQAFDRNKRWEVYVNLEYNCSCNEVPKRNLMER